MLLQDIFDQLAYGELANLPIGNGNVLAVADYPRVIAQINMGLTELHKRFPLKYGEVVVQLYQQIGKYTLSSKYAESNVGSSEPIKYILDSTEYPFKDDVLKVEQAFNEDGTEIPVNNSGYVDSLHTPQFNVIQVFEPQDENAISVIYRANHARIPLATSDATTVEVELNEAFLEPLLYYVAMRLYAGLGPEQAMPEEDRYRQKFEQACVQLKQDNVANTDRSFDYMRLEDNGWV